MSTVGDYVSIQFSSADASTTAAVTLYDSNGLPVTLGANERLLIDSLVGSVNSTAGVTTLADDIDSDGTVDPGEIITQFEDGVVNIQGGREGRACAIGKTPKVKAASAGQVSFNGAGRIVKGKTEGLRPSWKEALIGG